MTPQNTPEPAERASAAPAAPLDRAEGPFGPEAERRVCELVLGDRRHGL
ncbi:MULTISPECIES: hypothetical protein [Streptomyces]|nr:MULTISPECIES: hypothetical protein [Streptomyces]